MRKSIGLDVGGTNISAVLIDEELNVLESLCRRSDYYQTDYLRNIVEIIASLIGEDAREISGIGIGVPGIVESKRGMVRFSPALKWEEFALGEIVANLFDVATHIENDVNAWTLAEKRLGAAKSSDHFIMLTIGTGIGCGLWLDGKIYRGYQCEAGEIGYLPLGLAAYDKSYTYDDFGFFESRASTAAVSQSYHEHFKTHCDCKTVFKLAEEGNSTAAQLIEETYRYLGLGIGSLVCLLNPELIVIGGGMAQEGEGFLRQLQEKVKGLVPIRTKLCLTQVGDLGGAIGSATLGFSNVAALI